MEFRWLAAEEQRASAVESSSVGDVLALAQKLQAEGESLLSEDQTVEMGRELGIRPEYVREALRLRQARPPAPVMAGEAAPVPARHNPIAAVTRLFAGVFALSVLPVAMGLLAQSNASPGWVLFTLVVSLLAGWTARYPRLAGVAGGLAVPLVLVIAGLFHATFDGAPYVRGDELIRALLLCTPLSSLTGSAAARARRWMERNAQRESLVAPGQRIRV
jgi:hypothetical protein